MKAVVRPALLNDLDQVTELWACLASMHTPLDSTFSWTEDSLVRYREFAEERLTDPLARLLVAELQGEVVGFLLAVIASYPPVFTIGKYGSIYDVFVAEDCRGLGVGEQLVEDVLTWFRGHGLTRAELRVHVANEVGRRFWDRMGFTPFLENRSRSL